MGGWGTMSGSKVLSTTSGSLKTFLSSIRYQLLSGITPTTTGSEMV